VGYHLEDVIAAHGPGKVKDGVATAGVVDFVSVDENEALPRGNRPNERHVVFFTATSRAGLTAGESLRIGESKAPSDATFRARNAFTARYRRKVNLIRLWSTRRSGATVVRHDSVKTVTERESE
jgi:hypothetical protein